MTANAAGGSHSPAAELDRLRTRNWTAIAVSTFLMMFSYFTYGAAFVDGTGDAEGVEPRLVAIALTLAPFVFVSLAFLSHNVSAPRDVLRAMGLLLVVALAVGLVDPLLGAATGFAAGGALTLRRPQLDGVMRWRWSAVGFVFVYCLVLLVIVPPGGVFSGAIVPLIMIGIADEFAGWSAGQR